MLVWDAYTGSVIAGPFRGHTSSVNSVGFSPDGTRIFSGSSDMTIRTWNASTDNNVAGSFKGHTDSINSVAFSPDGAHVVSGSGDQTIRVWNSCTGDIVAGPFNGHSASVISVGFSPDGTHIVSASSDRTLRVWDARTGDTIVGPLKRPTDKVRSVGFSPDGTRIVSGSHETIQIWDARTGDTIIGLPGYIEPRFHVRWHPGSGPEFVWDSETDLGSGSGSDYQATHTPDEANIASGSDDETIRAWDLHTSDTIVETLQVHTDSDPNLDSALGSDCPWPAPFSLDHFRIFRKPYPATILVPYAQTSSESDGEIIGVLGDTIEPLQVHKDSGSSLDSDPDYRAPSLPDGTHVVSSSGYRNVCFAESISIREIEESGSDPDSELDSGPDLGLRDLIWDQRWGFDYWAAFSPDGTRILSGSDDGTIQVRDAHTGNTIAGPFQVHMGSGPGSDSGSDSGSDTGSEFDYWAAFSPDGTRIVSGSGGRSVRVCDAYTGSTIAGPFKGHTYLVSSAAFSPDNTHVVCGSDDGTIRVWDAHTGDIIAGPFEGHTGSVNSVAFSPDGARIVSGSSDQTIRVWAVRVGGTVGGPSERLPGTANSVGPSFDGTRVISNSYNDQDDFLSDASLLIPNPVQQAPIRGALVGTKDLNRCNDGWVTAANNTPLFWVPPDLQSLMPHPHNTLVIGSQGSVHLIYRKLKLGERWAQCYTPC